MTLKTSQLSQLIHLRVTYGKDPYLFLSEKMLMKQSPLRDM